MTPRRWKRTGYCLLAAAVGLVALSWAWRQALPAYLERRSVALLHAQGFDDAQIRIRSLGLRASELGDSRLGGPWGRVRLEHARVGYGVSALNDRRLEEIRLEGLHIRLNLDQTATPPRTGPRTGSTARFPPTSWHELLPVRRLLVSGGNLELRRGPAREVLPFRLGATNQDHHLGFRFEAANDETGVRLRLAGDAAGTEPLELEASFSLQKPNAWLPLLPPAGLADVPPPLAIGALTGSIKARGDLQTDLADMQGSLEPTHLSWPSGELSLERIRADGQFVKGLPDRIAVESGFALKLRSGLELGAGEVALRLDEGRRLSVTTTNLQFVHPGNVNAAGSFQLETDDATAGTDATGRLTFDLHRLEMPGVRVATLRGEFTGGTKHLDLRLPALELVAGGRWTFRNLVGQLTTPLNAEAGLTLAGEVAGNWASNLVAGNWLPLTIAARRSGEQISGTLALALTNLAMPAFVALPAGGVSGRVFLSGESSPDRSAGSLELDLALPEAACFGWRLRHLRIAGDARLALGAPKSPLLPGFLLRFLQAAPALAPERLVECFFTLRATAGRMSLAQSMAIEGLALTLSRTPEASGNPSQPASWATLAARVVRITAGGFELVDTGIEGFLEAETARFVGSTSLAGSRIPFEVRVQTGAGNPDASGLNGRLQLGPWRMEDFRLPAALTDGDDVRLTGSLMLAGDWQTGPDARWNFAPTLTLNLERLDWPDRRFAIENLQGELALTGLNPPTSSAPQRVDLGRIRFEDHELTQLEADLTLSGENGLQLELRRAAYLDGRVWSEPVRWNWRTGDLGLVLHAEGVDLHRLGTLLPHWEGTLSGRIDGRIPLQRKAGRWRLPGGRLELDRRVPARLEYPADGLLTGSMAPDAPRYQQLRMVEDGLKHLTLQALQVDLFDPQTPQTAVRVRLEGTSTSARAIVPVILNLNLNGPLEDLIELIHTDRLEFSF